MTRSLLTLSLVPLLLGLAACDDDKDTGAYRCEDVAMRDAGGDLDDCDVQACDACADACDGGCMVLESYPPQYACEGEGSWSVYDFCPDWQMPDFIPCDDATSTLTPSDATALGFSGDDVVAALAGPFDSAAEWVAEEGRADTVVHLAIVADGDPVFHDLSPSDATGTFEMDPACNDYLEVPVIVTLTTDDGAFDESLATALWVSDLATLSASSPMDWQSLSGNFQFATIDPSAWDSVDISLETALVPSFAGEVSISGNRDLGGGMGEGFVGALLRWPPM